MGTIAARDCLRILELVEQVAAALLIAVRQGVWLRGQATLSHRVPPVIRVMHEDIDCHCGPMIEDRRLDLELRHLLDRIRSHAWQFDERAEKPRSAD